jgi:hypothetical protein
LATGFFHDINNNVSTTASGLNNVNQICGAGVTSCTGKIFQAALAAQSYNDSGSHGGWFLPAGSPVSEAGSGYCNSTTSPTITAAGELCELYNQRAIINATAAEHDGSNFTTNFYWSSSEYAQYTYFAWLVTFDGGYQSYDYKSGPLSVRPVRAFNY